jgi:hypothetical protein
MTENSSSSLRGTVEKIITSRVSTEPEKAQISIEGADHLYKELRIENTLTDEGGKEVHFETGRRRGGHCRRRSAATVYDDRIEGLSVSSRQDGDLILGSA